MTRTRITAEEALAAALPTIEATRYDVDGTPTIAGETWRDVPVECLIDTTRYHIRGRYQASSLGRVRRVDGDTVTIIDGSPTQRKYTRITVGYRVWGDGRTTSPGQIYRHRMVAAAWHGLPRPGQQVRHLDGNESNDHPSNLAWGTSRDNWQDAIRLGEMPPRYQGAHWRRPPIDDATRRGIVGAIEAGVPYMVIADHHDVSLSQVDYYRRRYQIPRRRPAQPMRTA